MDSAALSSICNGFGYREEDVDGALVRYVKHDYCLDNLKDLQRFLRRDDPGGRAVFKQVCKWNVVARDLVPILESCQNDRSVVINTVKVLVFLTMPVDPTSEDIPLQVDYLWRLKGALARNLTIAVILSLLEDPLEHLESGTLTEDDWKLVQLVLTFFRNVLAIQDVLSRPNLSVSSTEYLHLSERFLELLFNENVMDLILVVVQHINDSNGYLRQDNVLLVEILHYMFQGHDPELLAKASSRKSVVTECSASYMESLRSLMDEEQEKSRLHRSRNFLEFNGTFTLTTVDGNKTVVKGNPSTTSNNPLLKPCQVSRGPLKKIACDSRSLSLPKENIVELLCNFLNNLLFGGYNDLMQSLREDIENEHDSVQNGDVITFFKVSCFVIAYQRHKSTYQQPKKAGSPTSEASSVDKLSANADKDVCCPIAATLNERMLLLVISKWRNAYDSLKQTHDYRTLSSAGSLMKNMIRVLDLVLKTLPEDSSESRTARVLLYKLFYDQTSEGFTQFLLNQIKSFDTHRQPKSDLVDLVELLHVILRLMENLQKHGALKVSRKSRKGKKKKSSSYTEKSGKTMAESGESIPLPDTNGLGGELSNYKLDTGLNHSIEDSGAQTFHADAEDASLRSSEEPGMHPFESIHHGGDSPRAVEESNHDLGYETDSYSDDCQQGTTEVDFNVTKLVAEFANSSAIQNLCWLLKFCKSNSASTNHYITCMLQRICNDLELSPLLYQLSFLPIFYDILSDQKMSKRCPDIVHFLTKLMRNMMKKVKHQPLLFVDILFLKTRKECHMINAEGLEHEFQHMKKEIAGLNGGEHIKKVGHTSRKSLADALGEDDADNIFTHNINDDMYNEEVPADGELSDKMIGGDEDGDHVTSTCHDLGNEPNAEKSHRDDFPQKGSTRRKRFVLDSEQESIIKSLYEKFKDERRCNHLIAEALDSQLKISPLQVSCKLRQLGLKVTRRGNSHSRTCGTPGENKTETMGSNAAGDTIDHAQNLQGDNTKINSRKCIRAFSQDQEIMIRNLYEQYKDNKQCCRMIANSLDTSNTYTAAQVSRKLKQLGLLPQEKKSTMSENSRPEGPYKKNSDEETLLTMTKRKRSKRRKVLDKEHNKEFIDSPYHENHFEDEPLSILLRKGDLVSTEEPEEQSTMSRGDKITSEINHADSDSNHQSVLEKHGEAMAELMSLDDDLEDEMNDDLTKQKEGIAGSAFHIIPPSSEQHDSGKLYDLNDSEDDMDYTNAPKRTGMRRKLKVDLGFEDDD